MLGGSKEGIQIKTFLSHEGTYLHEAVSGFIEEVVYAGTQIRNQGNRRTHELVRTQHLVYLSQCLLGIMRLNSCDEVRSRHERILQSQHAVCRHLEIAVLNEKGIGT